MAPTRDENDEPSLGDFGEKSLAVGVDWNRLPKTEAQGRPQAAASVPEFWGQSGTGDAENPDVVVFDPLGFGLAAHLEQAGLPVRVATTPVEVMMLAASKPTGAVACGPAADADRRRMLTAAIRSRFPWVGVVYFSTHGRKQGAYLAAKGEGAHELVPLPIPDDDTLRGTFGQYVDVKPRARPAAAPAQERPDYDRAEFAAFADTRVRTSMTTVQGVVAQPLAEPADDTFSSPTEVLAPRQMDAASGQGASTTFDPFEGIPGTAFDRPEPAQKGEVGQLMGAISPFLWGLEDAARWVEAHASRGDVAASNHAQTLKILASLLAQLQERIEDKGL